MAAITLLTYPHSLLCARTHACTLAGHAGERLNKLHREGVSEEEILAILTPLIQRYARERSSAEQHFGDWVIAAGVIKPTLSGRTFHDL